MTEEARKARNEYKRQYYATHKEKHKEYMERYWAKKSEEKRSDVNDTQTA